MDKTKLPSPIEGILAPLLNCAYFAIVLSPNFEQTEIDLFFLKFKIINSLINNFNKSQK